MCESRTGLLNLSGQLKRGTSSVSSTLSHSMCLENTGLCFLHWMYLYTGRTSSEQSSHFYHPHKLWVGHLSFSSNKPGSWRQNGQLEWETVHFHNRDKKTHPCSQPRTASGEGAPGHSCRSRAHVAARLWATPDHSLSVTISGAQSSQKTHAPRGTCQH